MQQSGDPVLLVCYRPHLQGTLETLFSLHNPVHVWQQDHIVVKEYTWKLINRLCIVSGARHFSDRDTIATIQQVAACEPFQGGKVIFVCQNSAKQTMLTQSRVVFPTDWDVCVTVDELEAALGETLSEEEKRHIEQRHLPRPLPIVHRRTQRGASSNRRRGEPAQQQLLNMMLALSGSYPQEGYPLIRIRRVGGRNDDADFAEAQRRSMEQMYHQGQTNIREEPRNERPWDKVFKPVIAVVGVHRAGTPEDHICCVCTENYATIKTIDEAGQCDHLVMCDDCARIIMDTTKKCPVCRAEPMTVRRDEKYLPEVKVPRKKRRKQTNGG